MKSYSTLEFGSVQAMAHSLGVNQLDRKTENRTKHIHALLLKGIKKYGKDAPAHVLKAYVKTGLRKSGRYGNPILILLMPFLIQFLAQIWPVVLQIITDYLNSLNAENSTKAVETLAGIAGSTWGIDD